MSKPDRTAAKRAVIYTRVSDTRGREDTISFDVQEKHGRRLCDDLGWTVVKVIKDPDKKGSTLDRPGLNEARAMVRDGKADAIVVWRLNRFARSMAKGFLALQDIVEDGGEVASASPSERGMNTSTAIGRGILALIFSLAEDELDRIRDSWADAGESAVAKGVYISNRTPYGYSKQPGERLEIDPETAPAVRELFEMAAAGMSLEKLTTWLRVEHGLTRAPQSVAYLIRNRVYLGEMSRMVRGRALVNTSAHDPIVDELTWRRAQRNGTRIDHGRETEAKENRLVGGYVRCAGCRSAMSVWRPNTSRPPTYVCRSVGANTWRCQANASVACHRVEDYVERQFLDWYARRRPEFEDSQGQADLNAIDIEIGLAGERLTEYRSDAVQRAYGVGWQPGLMERLGKLEALEAERDAILTNLDVPAALATINGPEDYLKLSVAERRRVLTGAIDYVFVRPSKYKGSANRSEEALADRVHVVWHPDGQRVEVPRSGHPNFRWRPYVFGSPTGD